MTAPLGNLTKSRNPSLVNSGKYSLQNSARRLLGQKFRVSACCRHLLKSEKTVTVVRSVSGSLSYGNVQKCGSVWVCPVCSSRISARRREELGELIDSAVSSGALVGMLTLTVPHGRGDDLNQVLDSMSRAKRLMQNRKPWKRFALESGLLGEVRALEVTHGVNGWHPHFHILLFFKSHKNVTNVKRQVLNMWADALETVGLVRPNDHGVSFKTARASVADYVMKFGIDYELTQGNQTKKARRDGRTPFQLLSDYSEKNDLQAGAMFSAYAVAFRGKRQLVYSRGLRSLFALSAPLTDEEIMQEDSSQTVVFTLSYDQWKKLCRNNLRGHFLDYFAAHLADPSASGTDLISRLFLSSSG